MRLCILFLGLATALMLASCKTVERIDTPSCTNAPDFIPRMNGYYHTPDYYKTLDSNKIFSPVILFENGSVLALLAREYDKQDFESRILTGIDFSNYVDIYAGWGKYCIENDLIKISYLGDWNFDGLQDDIMNIRFNMRVINDTTMIVDDFATPYDFGLLEKGWVMRFVPSVRPSSTNKWK